MSPIPDVSASPQPRNLPQKRDEFNLTGSGLTMS
jgi:hypothetical protein